MDFIPAIVWNTIQEIVGSPTTQTTDVSHLTCTHPCPALTNDSDYVKSIYLVASGY